MRLVKPAMAALAAGLLCVAALCPATAAQKAAPPAAPAAAQPAPDDAEPPAQSDEGGAGYLPGSQFQRKLDGGPGFVCTATNALKDQRCTASCQVGETADCVDADGGAAPSCSCTKE
jgi:hypothetical protein